MREVLGKPRSERAGNSFYTTDPECVKDIIERENIRGQDILENSAGAGHIAKVLKHHNSVYCNDKYYRGYPLNENVDFVQTELKKKKFDCAVYNPPFELLKEFILKTFDYCDIQYVFARFQALESKKRYENIYKYGYLEKVYIYTYRVGCLKNGVPSPKGEANTSMCFAWFKFNKNNKKEAVLKFIFKEEKQEQLFD